MIRNNNIPCIVIVREKDCFGFMLLNNHLFQRSIDGRFKPNTPNFIHLPITEVRKHVEELKSSTIENWFENN